MNPCPFGPGDVVAIWVCIGLFVLACSGGRRRLAPMRRGSPFVRRREALDPTAIAHVVLPRAASTSVHEQLERASGGRR